MSPITDFNPGARNDARRDPRYPAVLEQVRKMAWPAGKPMLPGGWADTLATDTMAAVRKAEGQHRLITHHTYEGPGPCTARLYGTGGCGYPEAEHAPADTGTAGPVAPAVPAQQAAAPVLMASGPGPITVAPGNLIALEQPVDPTFAIVGVDGRPLVLLHLDTGQVEFGPGYDPDESARILWEAVQQIAGQSTRARAANDRAWDLVQQWREEAVARGDDPHQDPRAQALSAALLRSPSTSPTESQG